MYKFYKELFLLFFILLFIGCSSKTIELKQLKPANNSYMMIENIIVEEFLNDYINQKKILEEYLSSHSVQNKKVFNIYKNYKNSDFIITGEVLESSIDIDPYYKKESDYGRCVRYLYDEDGKKVRCLRYRVKLIYCEKREYKVVTSIDILDKKEKIVYSKIYNKNYNDDECYANRLYFNHYYYSPPILNRDESAIYRQLAKSIAKDFTSDISVHYTYEKVSLIEELKTVDNKSIKDEFDQLIEEFDEKDTKSFQSKLLAINKKVDSKSYELLYNIALSYEYENNFQKALFYYSLAQDLCEDKEDNLLILDSIKRVNKNSIARQKALLKLKPF